MGEILLHFLFGVGNLYIELSSLCYTVGPCWLSLNTAVCTCHPKLPVYPFLYPSPLVTVSSFSKSVGLFLFCK